jgi:lambda family phage portal protein
MQLHSSNHQQTLFERAVSAMASMAASPLLYGPDSRPLQPSAAYSIKRDAAKRTGSLKNWLPKYLFSREAEALERRLVVERTIDLTNSDPHASGIVDTFASTIIGSGLTPHPIVDPEALTITTEAAARIREQQQAAFTSWAPHADAGGRLSFGQIEYLKQTCLLRYGEYFVILPMLNDSTRPYSLACQVVNPLRVKTPVDLVARGDVRDGIELGLYGEAVAIWVKKTGIGRLAETLPDISANFLRIPVKIGHRYNILHGFVAKEPEQVRGWPYFTPALKFFRDFSDLLNAELVSNVVTAALSYFVEMPGSDMEAWANQFAHMKDQRMDDQGRTRFTRYHEVVPGQVWYGNTGEKPHMLAAARPGTTFEPFVKLLKKSLAMAVNIPWPVLFKDTEGVNFAGFRSAMLDAWRVFSMERDWHGQKFSQPVYTMLQEEAYLRGDVDFAGLDFYRDMRRLTRCDWRGAPKGDIEPIKAVQAAAERGSDFKNVVEKNAAARKLLKENGLLEEVEEPDPAAGADDNPESATEAAGRTLEKIMERIEQLAGEIEVIKEHLT